MLVDLVEEQLNIKLTCYLNSLLDCSVDKEQAIRVYESLLNDEICSEILGHLRNLNGERLWGEAHLIYELKTIAC